MQRTYSKGDASPNGPGRLNRLAYFVSVAEEGSFTAAADRLGITKSVVSQQVARLERDCRTSLVVRTTRSVQLTEAGQAFYHRCAALLKDAEDAFDELAESCAEPTGTLRLTAPFDYGVGVVVPTIIAYMERFPGCKVDVVMRDQALNLMTDNIELAIRVGWLEDTSLQARKIGSFRQLLVASPSSWREIAQLSHPSEIAQIPFVANTALRDGLRWEFSCGDGARQVVNVDASLSLDATLAVREAACHGAGLSVLPDYAIADDLASGRLIHVLPHWSLPAGGIHAVFPAARFRPAKVQAFVNLLAEREAARQKVNLQTAP